MTSNNVTDEQFGKLCRRADEVKRRINEGTLAYEPTMAKLQELIEGKMGNKNFLILSGDKDPITMNGLTVETNIKHDPIVFDPMVFDPSKLELYLSPKQITGSIKGYDLLKELKSLKDKVLLNDGDLEKFLKPENWKYVPENCEDKRIYFWGTIRRDCDSRLHVRCLAWDGRGWCWGCDCLEYDWYDYEPAVLLANK